METRLLTPKTYSTWASKPLCCTRPASRIMRDAWKQRCRHTSGTMTSETCCSVRGGRAATCYYTSDRHIKLLLLLLLLMLMLLLPTRLQDQHDYAKISTLFITYAPASLSEQTHFRSTFLGPEQHVTWRNFLCLAKEKNNVNFPTLL